MASAITIQAVGDWNKKMDVPLHNALMATIEMTGRTGRQACEMAMIYMARSAKRMTPQARKRRKMEKEKKQRYVTKYNQGDRQVKWFEWKFPTDRGYTWEEAKLVGNRGLARRSWFWGLSGLSKAKTESKAMPGVATLREFIGRNSAGFILTNKLSYITKIMPAGFEKEVANKASNQIMAQAAKKMERKYGTEIPRLAARRQKRAQRKLEREFKRRQAA